jgi:diguanylate cyclase (GGDEF)-like protein
MRMHSVNLLVIDRSPDYAEHINSVLRNSGIKIHVIHTCSSISVKHALDRDAPVLILFANPVESDAPLDEISELANDFDVPLALVADLEDPEKLSALLATTACFVVAASREELLTAAVGRLIRKGEEQQAHRARQQHLEELEHRYALLLDSSRDAIAYIHEGLHVYANRTYLEMLRLNGLEAVSGLSLLEMFDAGGTNLKSLLKGFSKGSFPEEALGVRVTRPDGSEFEARVTFSPARFDGEDCTQMILQHKDAANELATELERLRLTDPLTQLHNRKSFSDQLENWLAGGGGEGTAGVLYVEPDGFGALQEELGVDVIDALIADLAGVIRSSLENEDVAARLNDRGFAVLAHRRTKAELEALAERILAACRAHIVDLGERSLTISCSIGLSNVGRPLVDASEIISRARKAQAEAAETGDQLVVYRPRLAAVSSGESGPQWVDRIKYALERNAFYSVQQSIIDLEGEGEQLFENLTYMRGETGEHAATEFRDVADREDLAGLIDRQVVGGLLGSLVDAESPQIINLSVNSVLDYGFPGWFADKLAAACVPGDRIILQITADAAQSNLRPAQRLYKELEPLGCRLSISEFGGERRCRQLLEHIDLAYIKLSPGLTANLTSRTENQETIRKLVKAAEQRGLEVIAGEVADTSSLAVLWQCGVKLVEGAFLQDSSQVLAQ